MPHQGAHIRVFANPIWHHGIYIGDHRVIHLSGGQEGKSFSRKKRACVQEADLKDFCGEEDLEIVRYANIMGEIHVYPDGDDINAVNLAKKFLGRGNYKVATNNCEHFAIYCKTKIWHSTQVQDVFSDLLEPKIHIPLVGQIPVVGPVVEIGINVPVNFVKEGTRKIGLMILKKAQFNPIAKFLEHQKEEQRKKDGWFGQ